MKTIDDDTHLTKVIMATRHRMTQLRPTHIDIGQV